MSVLSSQLLLSSAVDDEIVSPLVVASLVAARRLAPRRHRVTPAAGLAFTTAVRMIDRVHRDTAVHRAASQPARAAGFADRNIFVIQVADLTDGGHAVLENLACLP